MANSIRPNSTPQNSPSADTHWMVAAWPGMGNVSMLAAGYLVQKLGMKLVGEFAPAANSTMFGIGAVEVHEGIVGKPRLPHSRLYQIDGAAGIGKLTVFIGEAQPNTGAYMFANELMSKATQLGVQRVVTFASMASAIHPLEQPRVFGAGTTGDIVEGLRKMDVDPLPQGRIGGMNGILLGAAAERGVPDVCLMGEIPGFAPGVPNPRATTALLDAFGQMTGRPLDLDDLGPHIGAIDEVLMKMLEQIQKQQRNVESFDEPNDSDGDEGDERKGGTPMLPASSSSTAKPELDPPSREKIEQMFEDAGGNRDKAAALKKELDGLGVFEQYEDRFLDLFKR